MSEAEREAEIEKTVRTIFADPGRVPAEYRDYLRWQMGQADPAQAGAVANEFERMGRERYDRIACPTLIIWGEADSMNPPERGRRVVAAIPGARYAGLLGVGHTCQIEDPEGFIAALAPFLDETDALA
jgi:pimeloyl-ACP methyl ester carboxylesterase